MKKILIALCLLLSLTACSQGSEEPKGEVKEFSAEYEMVGTTSAGLPKNDTFIFEGETTDGIITKLNFDIIRNKGTDEEYSKKDLYGYEMNVSDAVVKKDGDKFVLEKLGMNGYTNELGQYMITAKCDDLTTDTTFKDLVITNYTGEELDMETSLEVYQYLYNELQTDAALSEDTPVSDFLSLYGLYEDGEFKEGENRVSFEGINGGRSYGEQIDAIVDYILANNMTLEDVYEMFRTENQQSTPIEDRDLITGATISFVGDFQRMVYLAINGELFEGVTNTSETDEGTQVEVVTQGYGGEIETHVVFDDDGKIVSISVRDSQETPDVGGALTADGSDFLTALVEGQGEADAVSGATVTSNALIKAVELAKEYMAQ